MASAYNVQEYCVEALRWLKAIYTAYSDIPPPPYRQNWDGATVDRRATVVSEYNIITDASTKPEYEKRDFYCIDVILYNKKILI